MGFFDLLLGGLQSGAQAMAQANWDKAKQQSPEAICYQLDKAENGNFAPFILVLYQKGYRNEALKYCQKFNRSSKDFEPFLNLKQEQDKDAALHLMQELDKNQW